MRKARVVFTVIAGLILLFQAGTNVALADDGGRNTLYRSRDGLDNVQVTANAETNLPLVALGGAFVSLGVWLLRRPARPIYALS